MIDTKQTKTIGEHWVASELARRDWAPALTRDGLERTDILAVKTAGERLQIEVQVKGARGRGDRFSWPLGRKSQGPPLHDYEWYVLAAIDLDLTLPVRALVMPRSHVAAAAWIGHMHWLTEPGVPDGKRNASVDRSRTKMQDLIQYEGCWDFLDKPTSDAPVLLPPQYREYALEPRVGLPDGHPWHKALPEW